MNLLREPLVHFALAGALLFGGYVALNQGISSEEAEKPVVIGEGEVRWLRETFASQWRRSPTRDEMDGLVATLVEEELLAREARALGLDENDTIVRRRLAQKLAFLVEDTSRIADPDEAELRRVYTKHAGRYLEEPRATFSQVYFSPQRRPAPEADATAVLTRVSAAAGDGKPPEGDPLLLDRTYADLDQKAVEALFGAEFAQALFLLTPGAWAGPLKSAYGIHLVRLTALSPTEPRRFEDVRDKVLTDWRRERQREMKAAYIERLREKHGVVVQDTDVGNSRQAGQASR
jgi:PPIC-type PPIASE domain